MSQISILVAAYNAEQTVRRTLDSLLAQTFAHWQAVCIDDCSTDRTLSILEEYAKRDPRITALHLSENGGQAHARNVGMAKATGDIVTFLDSDDWLAPDALQQVADTFAEYEQTDCVLFRVVNIEGDQEKEYMMEAFGSLSGREAFERSLDWSIHGVYAARRALYDRYPYDETCRAYSDDLTTHLHYYISREVRACQGTYYYWQNPLSVTHKPSVRRFDFLTAKERMRQYLQELHMGKELLDRYETLRWLTLVDCYMFYHQKAHQLTADERRRGRKLMRYAWQTIDRRSVDARLLRKFGYRPMATWLLFRLQEWAYFTLRGLLGR